MSDRVLFRRGGVCGSAGAPDTVGRPENSVQGGRGSRLVATAATLVLIGAGCSSSSDDAKVIGAQPQEVPAEVACPVGALDTTDGTTAITVWHSWTGLAATTLEQIADVYNASQDRVRVEVQAQGDYEELLAKYQNALADPSSLPDIVIQEATALRFMVDSDSAVPASACIEADTSAGKFYDQVLPVVTGAYTVEDELWPAGFNVAQEVLYVNQDHLEAAGLSAEDLPETLDELRDVAEAIRSVAVPGVEEPFVGLMDSWFLENQLAGVGQEMVDRSNGRDGLAATSELDNESSTATLEWLASMHDAGLYRPIPNTQPVDTLLAMISGTSSMLIGTSTAITSVDAALSGGVEPADLGVDDPSADELDAFRVTVAPGPGLGGAGRGRLGGMAWYLVDGDDASVAASWDFISFSNRTENQVRWTLEGSYLPVSAAARKDPALVEAFGTTRRGRWLATAADSLRGIDPDFPGPVVGPYPQLVGGVRTAIERVVLEDQPVQRAVDDLDAGFQDELTAYADEVKR